MQQTRRDVDVTHSFKMSALAVFLLFASIAMAFAVNYENSEVLDQKHTFFWTYNATEENMYFKVEVDAGGWVGLGFSDTNSGMANLDCVVGGVFAGTVGYLNDYHVDGTERPTRDVTQSYNLERSAEVNGKTTLELSRTRNTFDSNDMLFTVGKEVYVAFAYHNSLEATDSRSFPYHGSGRGYSSRKLVLAPAVTPKPTTRASSMTTPSPTASTNSTNDTTTDQVVTKPTSIITTVTPTSRSQGIPAITCSSVIFVLSLTFAIAFLY